MPCVPETGVELGFDISSLPVTMQTFLPEFVITISPVGDALFRVIRNGPCVGCAVEMAGSMSLLQMSRSLAKRREGEMVDF